MTQTMAKSVPIFDAQRATHCSTEVTQGNFEKALLMSAIVVVGGIHLITNEMGTCVDLTSTRRTESIVCVLETRMKVGEGWSNMFTSPRAR